MNTDNETLKHFLETWSNLEKIMSDVGGRLDVNLISKMSALEFIAFIAPNKIRFTQLSETSVGRRISDTSFDTSIL